MHLFGQLVGSNLKSYSLTLGWNLDHGEGIGLTSRKKCKCYKKTLKRQNKSNYVSTNSRPTEVQAMIRSSRFTYMTGRFAVLVDFFLFPWCLVFGFRFPLKIQYMNFFATNWEEAIFSISCFKKLKRDIMFFSWTLCQASGARVCVLCVWWLALTGLTLLVRWYFILSCAVLYFIIHSILPLSLALALPLLTVTVTAPATVLLSVAEFSWVEFSEWEWVRERVRDWLTEWVTEWVTEWWISSMMCLALIPIRATWAMSSWRWGNSTALFCTVCVVQHICVMFHLCCHWAPCAS